MRKRLRTVLSLDHEGKVQPPTQTSRNPDMELKTCSEKLEQIKMEPVEFARNDTLLQHLINRLSRLVVTGEEKIKLKSELLASCLDLYEEMKSKVEEDKIQIEDRSESRVEEVEKTKTEDSSEIRVVNETVVIKKHQIPVKDWGIKFSGDGQGLSINAFLESVNELKNSRQTTTKELFDSAYDLFRGPALITVKSLKRQVTSWEDLVTELKAEFVSRDYEDRLWEEIRIEPDLSYKPYNQAYKPIRNCGLVGHTSKNCNEPKKNNPQGNGGRGQT